MKAYVDSSVVLRVVLKSPDALPEWHEITHAVSNVILQIECLRTIDRMQHTGQIKRHEVTPAFRGLHEAIDRIRLVKITDDLIARAGQAYGVAVKSLDAIHVATATMWRERTGLDFPFATHDTAEANAARALGFEVIYRP